jgi:NAD(P)H dehydrogenase (quinone)
MGSQEAALGLIGNSDASGQVGQRVAQRLARQGLRQRLLVQDRSQAPELPQSEVAPISDYGDTESMSKAVAGVDAAVAAGVRRIVYSSFLAAAPDATFTFARHHYATEQHIRSTGVAFTFLRGSAFLEVLRWIIGADGVIRGPAGNGRLAPVARDDLAEVAAAVLTADGAHDGQKLCCDGPRAPVAAPGGRGIRAGDGATDQPCRRADGAGVGIQANLRRSGLAGRGLGHHLSADRQWRVGRGQRHGASADGPSGAVASRLPRWPSGELPASPTQLSAAAYRGTNLCGEVPRSRSPSVRGLGETECMGDRFPGTVA